MKKITTLFLGLLMSVGLYAADLNVDANGNIPSSYTTIQAAVAAASNGDRIIVYNAQEPYKDSLMIDKSLTIMPSSAESYFYFQGNMHIAPANGREITVVGCFLSGSILSAGNNTPGARTTFTIVDSHIDGLANFDEDGYEVNLLYCYLRDYLYLRMGNVIGNDVGTNDFGGFVRVTQESPGFSTGDTVRIIANRVWGVNQVLYFDNTTARYFIANNYFDKGSQITSLVYIANADTIGNPNKFIHNTIKGYKSSSYTNCATSAFNEVRLKGVDDMDVVNNFFYNDYGASYNCCALEGAEGYYNHFRGYNNTPGLGNKGNLRLNSVTFDEFGRATNPESINAGLPDSWYTDIDLTRADMGTWGGPYSWENYHPTSTAGQGRARIFNLDIPAFINSLTAPLQIKADATHMK